MNGLARLPRALGFFALALLALAAMVRPPSARAADLTIAALIPDQNQFYDAMYELLDMTIREEQGNGVLAGHNVGLDYTIYEFDHGYLASDMDTFANNSVVGFIGPNWSNDTDVAAASAANLSIPICDGGSTANSLSAYKNFFTTIPSDNQAAQATLAMIQSKGWPAAVLVTTTDVYGDRMANAYTKASASNGAVRVVGPFFFDPVSPFDYTDEMTQEQQATYGCRKVLNAVKSTGVSIVILAVDAYQTYSCFEQASKMDMLTNQHVYLTHDAGTEYMWRFAANDTAKWANSMIMSYPKDQIAGPGLDAWNAQWKAFDAAQYPTLDTYRTAGEIPPYLLYVRDCVRMLMRGYEKVVGTDEAKAEELAKGANGDLLKTMTTASFDFSSVDTATGKLSTKPDDRQREYDFFYAWDGKWVPFATWKGGNSIVTSAQNRYRDGSANAPNGGAAPGPSGGGSSSGGLSPLAIGLIVLAVVVSALGAALGFYFYRNHKLNKERKALVEARQLLVAWSSNPHNTQLVRQLTVTEGGAPPSPKSPNDDDEGNGSMASSQDVSPTTTSTPGKQPEMQQVGSAAGETVVQIDAVGAPLNDASPRALSGSPPPYVAEPPRAITMGAEPSEKIAGASSVVLAPAVVAASAVAASDVNDAATTDGASTIKKKKKKSKSKTEDITDSYLGDEAEQPSSLVASTSEATIVDPNAPSPAPKKKKSKKSATAASESFESTASDAAGATQPMPTQPAPAEAMLADAVQAGNDEAAVAAAAVAATQPAKSSLGSRMLTLVTSRGVRRKAPETAAAPAAGSASPS